MKPIYKRILLKISGEALQGMEKLIDVNTLERIAQEIKEIINLNIQVAIVIGGGNIFRGSYLVTSTGIHHIVCDYIGMLATIINGLAMQEVFHRNKIMTSLMSAIPIKGICNNYDWKEAINMLSHNIVVIFSAGTGNPLFTTDSAACLRGIEIEADIILKATKVDGVFSADPFKISDAFLYKKLNYQDVLNKKLNIMDSTAFTLACEYKIPIQVFNINKSGALLRIVMGEYEGTLITP
ncbi:MAG: UMP kinase [Candidatus Dasytiphilus stammeri]